METEEQAQAIIFQYKSESQKVAQRLINSVIQKTVRLTHYVWLHNKVRITCSDLRLRYNNKKNQEVILYKRGWSRGKAPDCDPGGAGSNPDYDNAFQYNVTSRDARNF